MKQSSTQLLMRHLYNETEPTENQAIKEAFQKNLKLKETYESYVETKQLLDYAKLNAPQYLVNGVFAIQQSDFARNGKLIFCIFFSLSFA